MGLWDHLYNVAKFSEKSNVPKTYLILFLNRREVSFEIKKIDKNR